MIRPILNEDDKANVVVVLRVPALNGETMSYNVKILKGEMPATGNPGKPVNIELHIGRSSILAAGNPDGDIEMMEFAEASG